MHSSRRLGALLAGAVVPALAAAAQAPSAWADLALANPVNPASVTSLGKLVVAENGTQVHAWSAFTRRWVATTTSGTATVKLMNDCALIRDGGTWTAFSSYGGRFAPLAVSPQAQFVNPTGRDNDSILMVLDAGVLHAFSGFTGTWVSRPVSTNAFLAVQRHVAVLADGGVLAGMDAFTGTWHDRAIASAVTAVSADGTAATADTATAVYGFSALRPVWSTTAAPAAGAAFVRNDDWAMWHGAAGALAYSGLTGTFAAAPLGPVTFAANEDDLAVLATAAGHVAYSPFTGTFSGVLASPAASVRASVAVAVFVDGLSLVGYSPVRGTSSSITFDSGADAAAGVVAAAQARLTGVPILFSALTGAWHSPPLVLQQFPVLTTTNALLPSPTGVYAFSARTGAYVHLTGAGLVLEGNVNSAPAAAWDAAQIHAFDPRTDRWVSLTRPGTGPLSVQIWRTELHVVDGGGALGFGAQDGTWHGTPLPEPPIGGRASSESATVVTNTHVFAFAAIPETSSIAQFPEFRRVVTVGSALPLQLRLPQGDVAILAGGPRAATPLLVPGIGTLALDPAAAATLLVLPDPGEDRKSFLLPVPNALALHGTEWWFQSLVVPGTGQPYLTGAASVYLP